MSRTYTIRKTAKKFNTPGRATPWVKRPFGVDGDVDFVRVFNEAGFCDCYGNVYNPALAMALKEFMPKHIWWKQIGRYFGDRSPSAFRLGTLSLSKFMRNQMVKRDRGDAKNALKKAEYDWYSYQDPVHHTDKHDRYFD